MPNPFDQFDSQTSNPFDQFDNLGAQQPGPVPTEAPSAMGGTPVDMPKISMEHDIVRPTLEYGGLAAGAAIGSVSGPTGSVAGGGLGYAAGKQVGNLIYDESKPLGEELKQAGKDVVTGSAMEAGGQILGKAGPWAFNKTGEAFKAVHGRLTGVGKSGTEAALQSGKMMGANPFKNYTEFDKALRGKISGEEVVNNAKIALGNIKDIRSQDYVSKLEKIKLSPAQLNNVQRGFAGKVNRLLGRDKFDIKIGFNDKGPTFDFSNSTLVEGQPVIEKALKDVVTWKDNSAAGLDVLKKRLSTYAGQVKRGTPQEAFLNKMENALKSELNDAVPGYSEMTKGYAEATNLIKDIEAGLMMRKQGMSGRIVADQTLRRLTSSMKDNFALRKDLVRALSAGGEDIEGQIGGYAMRSVVPIGLSGTGPAMIGSAAAAKFINPAFWPVLASSSPRVSAEFLRIFGKTLATLEGTGPMFGRALMYEMQRGMQEEGGGEIKLGTGGIQRIEEPGLKKKDIMAGR